VRLALIDELVAPLAEPDHRVVASGGALVRSRAWMQMVADALGRPLLLSEEREASSRGAALLASAAAGRLADLDAAARTAGTGIEPIAARRPRFAALRARQRELYAALVAPGRAAPLSPDIHPG
jgi:gluconokinase